MKFRFCGDLDAPDWILAEVSVLSKMSSIRMTLICRLVLKQLLGEGMDYEKLGRLTSSQRLRFESGDVKAMIAALHFILSSSAKYDVAADALMNELQQLGLPKDISVSITRCFESNKAQLRQHFLRTSLRLPRVTDVNWRVDYVLASSALRDVNQPVVRLSLSTSENPVQATRGRPLETQTRTESFEVSLDKFRLLVHDLRAAKELMDSLV